MSSCDSNAGMETPAPLINVIVNNALFHSKSYINQICCLKSFTSCAFWLLAAPYFVTTCNVLRSGLFGVQKCGSSYGCIYIVALSDWYLEAANDAQNVRVYTACGKDNYQQNLSEIIGM